MKRNIRQPSGFTMLEVLVATSIMSFAVIAITQAVSVAQMQTYEALHDSRATTLAEAFLEEAISKPYADPSGGAVVLGPDAGESSRSLFDNIDDYAGFTLDAIKTPNPDVIADIAGNQYPSTYQKFSVNISTSYTTVTLFDLVTGITVTVTITDQTGRTWQATRFIPESGG